jgi:hypothetical protein
MQIIEPVRDLSYGSRTDAVLSRSAGSREPMMMISIPFQHLIIPSEIKEKIILITDLFPERLFVLRS